MGGTGSRQKPKGKKAPNVNKPPSDAGPHTSATATAARADSQNITSSNIYGHVVLSERHAKFEARPAEGLPDGWVIRDIPRMKDNTKTDSYWYSPILEFKFRSKADITRFLGHLEEANGDEGVAIKMLHGKSSKSPTSNNDEDPVISVGDVGYTFRKQFGDGSWYTGSVVKIRPGAGGGKDRRCYYEDGDSEDLSLSQLRTLALLDTTVTKKSASTSTKSNPPKHLESNNDSVDLPLPQNGSVYKKSEAAKVILSFPKCSRERKLAIESVREQGYVPISERNLYKLIAKAEQGNKIEDTVWHLRPTKPMATWDKRFLELKEYKKKHGCVCPNYTHHMQLASWVKNQRTYHRKYVEGIPTHIDAAKIAQLKSIDFVFRVKDQVAVKSEDNVIAEDSTKSEGHESEMEESEGADRPRKSKRRSRPPPKCDEVYTYELIKRVEKKRARVADSKIEPGTPDKKAQLLSSLEDYIPYDKAAEGTMNFRDTADDPGGMRSEKNEPDDADKDDDKWLEKVAVSLGAADKSSFRQKRLPRPMYRSCATSPLDEPAGAPRPSASLTHLHSNATRPDTISVCSTITCTSDNNPKKESSAKYDIDITKQPPDAVLLSHTPSASADAVNNESLSLLSEISEGSRHGCLIFHRNDSRRRVGEVILEDDSTWVQVATNGELKEYRASHLIVVSSNQFKAGDTVPSNFGASSASPTRASPSKKSRAAKSSNPSPSEKKPPALAIDKLFCWFCDNCDSDNKIESSVCHSCNTKKTTKSKRSVLLAIAEKSIAGNVKSVDQAMSRIPYSERPSIPEKLIAHLLQAKTSDGDKPLSFVVHYSNVVDTYFYWMCGSCTMQNSYKRTTCTACLQAGLSEKSPLLSIAAGASIISQTSDDALSMVPPHERMLIPRAVMDVLVTCIFMIESRNGRQRRCRKMKKDGFDYCEAHFDPILLNKPRADTKESSVGSPRYDGADSVLQASPGSESGPPPAALQGKIAAINEIMPSFLRSIDHSQVNELKWTINSIEDSVLCKDNAAFPLGMKVRKFFLGYGYHDGRLIKVARKLWADSDTNKQRPVLVYRCKYNDGDQEDYLHHEIASLSQLYDRSKVPPEAPPEVQIPPEAMFETRSGHTIEIIGHRTPPASNNQGEGGIVIVRFRGSSKNVELDLFDLEKTILRKVQPDHIDDSTGDYSPTKSIISSSPTTTDVNETAATLLRMSAAPVLEWPSRRDPNQNDEESNEAADEYFDICEGLTLHRNRCNTSPGQDVVIPASSTVNNPCDVRPGCKVGMMWDPAACYDHLAWDPYATTMCEVCGVDKNDHQLLICDECHRGFHTYCLRPVMVNIPKGNWLCSGCSGRSNEQMTFEDYSEKMSNKHQDILQYLNLAYNHPTEFFRTHSEAISLFSFYSQAAVKQQAISQGVVAKNVVFDVGNIKFIRAPEKNDWRLPTPLLSEQDYTSSILSMVAAMKYCGMNSNLVDLTYSGTANEEMNDPSLEIDKIAAMSKRNLEVFRAFKANTREGIFPPIQIFHDKDFGFSVKALASMHRHTLIGEYLGEVVTMEQSGQSNSDSLMVLLDTGDPQTSLIIDPTRAGNIARFLSGINNRSLLSKRKANVRTRRFMMDGKVHVCLFTSRRVDAGEILNYDYNAGNEGKDVDQWAKSGFYDTSNFF